MPKTPRFVENPTREQAALIRYLAEHPDLTVNSWANEAEISEGALRKFLTKKGTTINLATLRKLAAARRLTPQQLLGFDPTPQVTLVGYIGAGNTVTLFEGDAAQGFATEIEAPEGLENPEDAAALEIRGDSMLPLEDGWRVFYRKSHHGVTADEVNRLCVVQLRSGNLLLKKLRRGYAAGRFNLESWNAPLLEDQEVEWATPVVALVPR